MHNTPIETTKSLDEQVAQIQVLSQSKEIRLPSKGSILEIAMNPSNVGVAPEGSRVDGGGINAYCLGSY